MAKNENRIYLIIFFIFLIVVFSLYVIFLLKGFSEPKLVERDIDDVDERIKLVVFNGCRNSFKTVQITDMIRRNAEIDVVDIIKSPGSVYPRTVILDRVGDSEKMVLLADILGLSEDVIIKQRADHFVDATLIIGLDHEDLWKTLTKN